MTRIVGWVIASGQMSGELRGGDPTVLARCVLAALDGHCNLPTPADTGAARPTLEQIFDFCLSAIRAAPAPSDQASDHRMHASLH